MEDGEAKFLDSDPLQKLLSMPLAERIAAVSEDLRKNTDEFRKVNPHKLAEALGVPETLTRHWRLIYYASKMTLEEYAEGSDCISELVFLIKDKVSAQRFETLVEKSADLIDYCADPQFDFLRPEERRFLEQAIALEQLQLNMENGICCVAHYSIPASGGDLLFEVDIEDDGACIDLRTPYGKRDGSFLNLDDCVTDSLLWEKRFGKKSS